jgi:mannan endo-1,6-alpha-mannosidase
MSWHALIFQTGTDELLNCSAVDHTQWTYNVGAFLYGAAILQNYTKDSTPWLNRTIGLLGAVDTFVTPFTYASNIMFEAKCELDMTCNMDQLSMKAYLIRWLAGTSMVAPFTRGRIGAILRASAQEAAASCTGGPSGTTCGSKWYVHGWDGTSGLGQQLCAMELMYCLLVNSTDPPAIAYGVPIEPAAPSQSISTPQPTETARPLHDAATTMKTQNKVRSVFAAALTTLVLY